MPTVLRDGPYRFFFYSGDGGEPRHVYVYVESGGSGAKFWLDPVDPERHRGYSPKELNRIREIIVDNLNLLRDAWDGFFNP